MENLGHTRRKAKKIKRIFSASWLQSRQLTCRQLTHSRGFKVRPAEKKTQVVQVDGHLAIPAMPPKTPVIIIMLSVAI